MALVSTVDHSTIKIDMAAIKGSYSEILYRKVQQDHLP